VTVHVLWYAPFYAWFLLMSAWARRAPILWAFMLPFAIGIFEKIAFDTSYFAMFLLHRFAGGTEAVGNMQGGNVLDPGMHVTPGQFLISPGLWLGLAVAAGFLAAAVRLRRLRGPV
jgi:ABC-2 type transport system permease protein